MFEMVSKRRTSGTSHITFDSRRLKNLSLCCLILTITTFDITAQELTDAEIQVKLKRKITLRSERLPEVAGRTSITGNQLKEAPGTFGDSLNALTSLPGIMRPNILFGGLVIRGMGDEANRYFVDGIPIPLPQHFGGIHSIISNDILKEVNVYASAKPLDYANTIGAVLEFETLDEVDKFGTVIDIGLLSANVAIKAPWSGGELSPKGFWLGSGRIGYLPFVVAPIYEQIAGDPLIAKPEYFDFQLKGKIVLDDDDKHQLSLLIIGSRDRVKVEREANANESFITSELAFLQPGASYAKQTVATGLTYDFRRSEKLKNKLLIFNSYATDDFSRFDAAYQDYISSVQAPGIAGVRNATSFRWLNSAAELKLGLEYSLYYYHSSSVHYEQVSNTYQRVELLDNRTHHVPAALIENEFRFGKFKITPSVRTDYLLFNGAQIWSGRNLIAYEFLPGTNIEAIAGYYQSLPQVNSNYLLTFAYQRDVPLNSKSLRPEESRHGSLAVSKELDKWRFKVEGYWLRMEGLLVYQYFNADQYAIVNGTLPKDNYGVELTAEKKAVGRDNEFFGWVSYALSRAAQKTNQPRTELAEYDQTHVLKFVAGFLTGIHAISLRFDLSSGFPYQRTYGSYQSTATEYYPLRERYRDSRYPMMHRLSLRYAQSRQTTWGSWSWYIEVFNATNAVAYGREQFDYNRPYEPGVNPQLTYLEPRIPILPNFGVEVRF
jgi:hypothetical protein